MACFLIGESRSFWRIARIRETSGAQKAPKSAQITVLSIIQDSISAFLIVAKRYKERNDNLEWRFQPNGWTTLNLI